ncbi:hypothetical protein [Rhodococcus sovatensis]|uniref:Uncharacterized protein n=1 Tax=Rhodococcus sovatensis TaxID=1805840 RepID=A0ABZ2PHD1_9NOCA
MTRRVRMVACAPLGWLAVTLISVFALAPWWNIVGDVVVTWNVVGVFGLVLTLPGALVVLIASTSLDTRAGRWFTTAGFAVLLAFCAWMMVVTFDGLNSAPRQYDDPSMVPKLTTTEQLVFTTPYVLYIGLIAWVLLVMWRRPSASASTRHAPPRANE